MYTLFSNGIEIKVEPTFREDLSDTSQRKHVFSYLVTIQNQREYAIRLMERSWTIFDSAGTKRLVNGPGVVGEQPIIEAYNSYSYSSWCPLESDLGYMSGEYLMRNMLSDETFVATIPLFWLHPSYKLN